MAIEESEQLEKYEYRTKVYYLKYRSSMYNTRSPVPVLYTPGCMLAQSASKQARQKEQAIRFLFRFLGSNFVLGDDLGWANLVGQSVRLHR